MERILVPVDGSSEAQRAVKYAADLSVRHGTSLQLLNVQVPIASAQVRRFVARKTVDDYQLAEGERALASARKLAEACGVPYDTEIAVGHIAETIAERARELGCHAIVMGSRGMGSVGNLVMGSVATEVVHLTELPVTLVKAA
jgi:nucleotide-binding universal stress UspA family protein